MASQKSKRPPSITWYLHITPQGDFAFTNRKTYNQHDVDNRLSLLKTSAKKHLKANSNFPKPPGELDLKFIAGARITIRFGNTMPNWEFWTHSNPRFINGINAPIAISSLGVEGMGWFKASDIKFTKPTAKKGPKSVSFIYTGRNGTTRKPLKCQFDLCVNNIKRDKNDDPILQTKIIIDPLGKNDGRWP